MSPILKIFVLDLITIQMIQFEIKIWLPKRNTQPKFISLLFFIRSHNENKGKLCSFKKLQKRKFMVSCKKVFSQRSCLWEQ